MKLTEEEIDDLITLWHATKSELRLHEFLGWTWDEYTDWVESGIVPETDN
jgi:hypothetical protein